MSFIEEVELAILETNERNRRNIVYLLFEHEKLTRKQIIDELNIGCGEFYIVIRKLLKTNKVKIGCSELGDYFYYLDLNKI